MGLKLFSSVIHACKTCSYRVSRCLTSNQNFAIIFWFQRICAISAKLGMQIISPMMLAIGFILIFAVVYVYFRHLLYKIASNNIMRIAHVAFGVYILVNILFNYITCVRTPPGTPDICDDPAKYLGFSYVINDGRRLDTVNQYLRVAPGVKYKYCRYCRCIKPPRAHHCSITGKCILNMDHFCPWMNNCIGYYNYRYFLLFLVWLTIGVTYLMAISFKPFLDLRPGRRMHKIKVSDFLASEANGIVYAFTIGISIFIAVGILLGWHVYLTITNQTTLEFYINMDERSDAKSRGEVYKNPYDRGWRKNLLRVFGDVPWYKAILMSYRLPIEPEYPFLPEPFSNANKV